MSIEERNRIVLLERRVDEMERRVEQIAATVAKLIDEKIQAEQAKTIKLPEQKRA